MDELLKCKEHIEILAAIGTFISAIVALYMIIEIKKQRKSTYKPELFLDSFCFYVLNNPFFLKENELVRYRTSKYNEGLDDSDKEGFIYVNYKLENLGFGFAKSVECKWDFDYKKALGEIRKLLPEEYEWGKVLEYITITNDAKNFYDSFYPKDLAIQTVDFIQPSFNGFNNKKLSVPHVIVKLYVYYFILKNGLHLETAKNFHHENLVGFPTIKLKLKYKDLANETYTKTLKLSMEVACLQYEDNIETHRDLGIFFVTVVE